MNAALNGERMLTRLDIARLRLNIGQLPAALNDTCESASLVPSQVEIIDLYSRRGQKRTLRYPIDAKPGLAFVSVLSPVGASLRGLTVGAVANGRKPDGDEGAAELAALFIQPEASGDDTT